MFTLILSIATPLNTLYGNIIQWSIHCNRKCRKSPGREEVCCRTRWGHQCQTIIVVPDILTERFVLSTWALGNTVHLGTWALEHFKQLRTCEHCALSTWALWAVEERNFYKLTANNTGWVGDGALELALSPGILVDLGIVIPEGIVLKSEGLFYGLSSFNWSGAATERYFDMIPIVIKITL